MSVNEIAKMIDHSLLHPTMTDEQLIDGCKLAVAYDVASVCIKPYAVKMAARLLEGTDVLVGTVIGFPHGNSTMEIKADETEQACEDGAAEIDMVVNIGKALGNQWDYIEEEIDSVASVCRYTNAVLKVIFENDYLTDDTYKIKLCQICNQIGVDFVKTSTGYGFVKQADGLYTYNGATDADLILMRKYCNPEIQVKAAGGIRTLQDVLRVKKLGVTRVGATATAAILKAAKEHFGEGDAKAVTDISEGY